MPLPADGRNTKLGKGSLLLAAIVDGEETGLEFVGNVSSLTLSSEVTKAQLFSSTQRSAPLLAEAITRIAYTLTATCNEFTLGNMKRFLLGDQTTTEQVAAANVTVNFAGSEVVPDRYLDTRYRRITNVSVMRDGTDALVLGTDYSVLSEFGLIKILEGGSVAAGDAIAVEFDSPELTVDHVRIAKEGGPVAHLLYLSDDSNVDGASAQDRLELWKVQVSPEGDMNFISDEFGSFQLTMSVLSDDTNLDNPFGDLSRVR